MSRSQPRIRQMVSKTLRGILFPELIAGDGADHFLNEVPPSSRFAFIGYLLTLQVARSGKVNPHYAINSFAGYREYIERDFFRNMKHGDGLMNGYPGIALGTLWAMNLGILPIIVRQQKFLQHCFEGQPDGLDMASGFSGKVGPC